MKASITPFLPTCLRAFALAAFLGLTVARGAGIYEDGASARSKAMGGITTAGSLGGLDALNSNPAALSNTTRTEVELGGDLAWGAGDYTSGDGRSSGLGEFGARPHGAITTSLGQATFGLGFVPDSTMRADWRFRDAPGGLDGGTSYGSRQHYSELQVLRFALGASYRVASNFSVGASLGVLYNRNVLRAPYTIQNQPQLRTAKVLLDLDTEGWGVNASFGALWKPIPTVQVGASYTLASRIRATGRAHADASRQLSRLGLTDVDATADFDGEVTNNFPQIVSGSISWEALPRWTLLGQIDWTDYRDSFDSLDVRLKNVDNALYRQLLAGGKDLNDRIPLNWRDQLSFRFGTEYGLNKNWTVRAGYRYAPSAVPDSTLTPVTASIGEHLVTAGLGYSADWFAIDLAWQWELPATQHVGRSDLLTGEYSGTKVTTEAHYLSLTTRFQF